MRKYPTYKASGIEWLGEIPMNWDFSRLKMFSKIYSGGTPDRNHKAYWENGTIPWIASGEVNQEIIIEPTTYITEEAFKNSSAKWIPLNSIVMALAGQGRTKGTVAVIGSEVTCNQSLAAIVTRNINYRFLFYWLKSKYQDIRGLVGEDRDGLNLVLIGNIPIPLTTLPEQLSIVRFLDYKTGQIDRFVANRQKQIELLKEQKAAIINKAVTKGINPKAKMKLSGIDWLEEVPEHWKVGKVRRVLDILTDFTANGSFADLAKNVKYLDTPDYSRLIRLTDLREDLKNDGIYVSKEAHEYLSKSELYGGEILMANVGAYAGLVCLVPKIDFAATLGPNMFLLKFEEKRMSNRYAFTLLGSDCYYRLLMNKALSSAQPKLNKEDVKSIDFIFPPSHKEQQEILDFIQAETSNIDTLISKYQRQIDLMQEYRTSLISQAVTGKIDVREWQPKAGKYQTEELPVAMAAEN